MNDRLSFLADPGLCATGHGIVPRVMALCQSHKFVPTNEIILIFSSIDIYYR